MVPLPGCPPSVVVFGAALRGTQAAALLDELVGAGGSCPSTRLRDGMAFRDLKRSFAGTGGPEEGAQVTATSRSEFFARPLPPAAISALLDELTGGVWRGRRELNFTAMGGACNRVAADATAFAHRGERFLLEHAADDDPQWVDRSWAIAHAHGSGRVFPLCGCRHNGNYAEGAVMPSPVTGLAVCGNSAQD